MRASVFSCIIVAASLSETNALRQLGGGSHQAKVAGIVAVHQPTFKFFTKFMREWEACPEGREAMDLMPVFSSEEDHEEFKRKLKRQYDDFKFDDNVFTPLIAQSLPQGAKPGAWKKFDGLAQVLSHMDGYEFALIFDAEIRLNTCKGFSTLLDKLRKKHSAGTWYGDRTGNLTSVNGSVVNNPDGPVIEHAALALGMPGSMQKLAQQTNDFQVFTWWNDLPYVHIATAQRMFQSWADYLKTADPSAHSQRKSAACEQCHVLTSMIPHMQLPDSHNQRNIPATSVAGSMGAGHGEAMEIAGRAFEHLVYQLYTVAEGAFHIKDLTSVMHDRTGGSLLERFWYSLPEEDRKTVIETIHPLWLPCGRKTDNIPEGSGKYDYHMDGEFPSVLMNFHLDRGCV